MTCWCEKYHSYQLGTKQLNICECSCHAGRPQSPEDVLRRIDADLAESTPLNYLDLEAERARDIRFRAAQNNLARRGFVFPVDESYLRTYDIYIDENPERWYENYE
jgi:hypothetical protein